MQLELNNSPNLVNIRPIALPRYEIEYQNAREALVDSQVLQQRLPLHLGCRFREPAGTRLVVDLRVRNLSANTTFLVQILRQHEATSLIEWVPRRRTDPDLMGLWLDSLQSALPGSRNRSSLAPEVQQELLDLCRRTLSPNPFTVLGISWGCTVRDVQTSIRETRTFLAQHEKHPGLNPRLDKFVTQARVRLIEVERELASLAGRQRARKKYVQPHDLAHALDLVRARFDVALLQRDQDDIRQCQLELAELMPIEQRGVHSR